MLVTQSEFARLSGVSRVAVTKWKKRGWLVLQGSAIDVEASNERLQKYRDSKDVRASRGKRTPEEALTADGRRRKVNGQQSKSVNETSAVNRGGAASVDDAAAELIFLPGESAEDAADRLTSGAAIDVGMTIEEARRVKEVYLALLNRLTYEEKSGALISLDLARGVLFESARAARDAWLNWPTRVAPLIAADVGIEADRMMEILTEHVHKQIATLGDPDGDFSAE